VEPERITPEEVRRRTAAGERVVLVDTRNPHAWAEAETKLPGAIRVPADAVDEHLDEIPRGAMIVTYCT